MNDFTSDLPKLIHVVLIRNHQAVGHLFYCPRVCICQPTIMPARGVRIHYVVPLVIAYVIARSALADLVNSTHSSVEYEVSPSEPAPHVVALEEHVPHVAASHVPENYTTDHRYHDPLFGPHDPNRIYTTKEKKYFQVGVIDFERVRTPFVIGSWILAASLAKIGEYCGMKEEEPGSIGILL